jgi:hypothetical protein
VITLVIFDFVIFVVFGLVVAAILFVTIKVAWAVRPRRISVGIQTVLGGATHIIPGEGHVAAEDCMCHPRVDGLHGEFVEHRALRTVHR